MQNKYNYFREELRKALPLGQSFDILEREIVIYGLSGTIYFIDDLADGGRLQFLISVFQNVNEENLPLRSADDFIKKCMPYADVSTSDDLSEIEDKILKGLVPVIVDGLDKAIILDLRDYPSRALEEPGKERNLRGARDGFTENYKTNIALIRRRIRSTKLIFENYTIGNACPTDISIAYLEDLVDKEILEKLQKRIKNIDVKFLTVTEQSLVEAMFRSEIAGKGKFKSKLALLNPLPKVRYSQRPDVVSAHITEGRIAIITDNSPTVLLLPASIFEYFQEVDDYYFPVVTGNYFRFLRFLNFFVVTFASTIFYLMAMGEIPTYSSIEFFIPDENYAIPLFAQFLLIEIAIDGLKLASLNTPDSLGMSLSIIGALILGEFSVDAGWFIPQTILVMSVVALASFTQPSIELGYGIKCIRIILFILSVIFGLEGFVLGVILGIIIIARTRTIVGTSYLYPLIPFNARALKRVLGRTVQTKND